jgi:hypothetical protein
MTILKMLNCRRDNFYALRMTDGVTLVISLD